MTGENTPDPGREPDAEEIDRAFAEMVAHYDREAPDPPADSDPVPGPPPEWARFTPRRPDPEPADEPNGAGVDGVEDEFDDPDPEDYLPPPLGPPRRPGPPVLVALLLIGFSVGCAVVTMLGVGLPSLARLLAVVAFVAGFVTLVSQLPRTRPEDDDGVVL